MRLTRRTINSYSASARRAFAGALPIPLVYVVLSTVYILFSGRVAKMLARDTEQLAAIESIKGVGFVLITGALLFVLCFLWLRRLQRQQMLLVQSERMAFAGMASATVAHDLNNLLMALRGFLEELAVQEDDESFATMQEDLKTSIDELSQRSKSLVRAARQLEPGRQREVELSSRLLLIAKLLSRHPDVRQCEVIVGEASPVKVVLNAVLFEQAALNLIVNAAQAAGPGGKIGLSIRPENGTVVFTVEDSGPGVPGEQARVIFAPGYTTKQNGSGLGLLCVRAFADSVKGTVSVERSQLGGAAFAIRIPVSGGTRDQGV